MGIKQHKFTKGWVIKGGRTQRGRKKATKAPPPPQKETPHFGWCGNDPSAGSPTETLLRLHLPLNDEV